MSLLETNNYKIRKIFFNPPIPLKVNEGEKGGFHRAL